MCCFVVVVAKGCKISCKFSKTILESFQKFWKCSAPLQPWFLALFMKCIVRLASKRRVKCESSASPRHTIFRRDSEADICSNIHDYDVNAALMLWNVIYYSTRFLIFSLILRQSEQTWFLVWSALIWHFKNGFVLGIFVRQDLFLFLDVNQQKYLPLTG